MDLKREWRPLVILVGLFLAFFYLPVGTTRFDHAVLEGLHLAKWYAREHVVLCLIPAFFIAGAIGVFVSQASVMKYLGASAPKGLAYAVASVSGTVLAVCSCTVLPLFAGIYRMGAGLGPACAFLYSGPAINVLAIILTARVLGLELGVARAIGAIGFSLIIGLLMQWIFRTDRAEQARVAAALPAPQNPRPLGQTALYFASMIGILVFANWGSPAEPIGLWAAVHSVKWIITSLIAIGLAAILAVWFGVRWWKLALGALPVVLLAAVVPGRPLLPFSAGVVALVAVLASTRGEGRDWLESVWGFTKQIVPLLLIGVLISGILLGAPGRQGLLPPDWISRSVGGNSLGANLFASVAGALMYFATLTEVPILQGLIANGMGRGPALALLLAGPALSLPSMLVIGSVLGKKKALVFIGLVVGLATLAGLIFGALFG